MKTDRLEAYPTENTMNDEGIFRRRHLPHWDVEGKPFFITACLDGSISAAGLKQIRQYRMELEERSKPDQMSVDHWARDEAEMLRIIDYIEHNPVKAGLVDRPELWQWSSASLRLRAGIRPGEPIVKVG